jgi:dihydropteroate synthase
MRPLVLGILNVTPDSFSDGGRYLEPAAAVARAEQMLAEGADVIDVGGESTRPGAAPLAERTELERVIPVIEALAGRCRLSIDTRHRAVAEAAVDAGATLINDVSASLYPVAAEAGVGWLAMHMLGEPATMQDRPRYRDVVSEVLAFLVERADAAAAAGVGEVWIDPGFGFGKDLEHNLQILAAIDRFVATGYPVAVGTSRKGMCGALLAESDGADEPVPLEDRLEASLATATWAMVHGARMVRAHDVKAAWQAAMVVAGAPATAGKDSSRW